MSKHTPGPWKVIETNHLPHDGDHVADMSNGLMVVPVMYALGDPLADAQLIAAAPDMLETLKRLSDMCADFGAKTACDMADAAIFKATGEQA